MGIESHRCAVTTITSNTGAYFTPRKANYSSLGVLTSLMADGTTLSTFTPDADGTGGINTIPAGGNRTSHATATHATADVSFTNANLNAGFRRQYHFDQAGRIDQAMSGTATSFAYDQLGRLQNALTWSSCTWGSFAWPGDTISGPWAWCGLNQTAEYFTYDAMGNRTDKGGVPTTGNRYTSFNGASYTYDADGNLIRKYKAGVYDRLYYWNAVGQLDSAKKDGSRVGFSYNALGQPVRITDGAPTPSVVSYLLWDGDALSAELTPTGQLGADYINLPGTIDHPFAVVMGTGRLAGIAYKELDELNNVIGMDVNGSVTQSNTYDAWGTATTSIPGPGLYWKGLYWSGDLTGLHFVRNRWYDPDAGRFVSEDPVGFAGGLNLYAFAENDPINGTDPYGLWCVKLPLGKVKVALGDCNGKHVPRLLRKGGWGGGYADAKIGGPPPVPDAATRACMDEYQSLLQADIALVSMGAIPSGKDFVSPKASPVSSHASAVLRRLLPVRVPIRQWAPTFLHPDARSTKVGGIAGRWTPLFGFGLLLEDLAAVGQCAGYYRQLR